MVNIMEGRATKSQQALLEQISQARSEPEIAQAEREADLYLGRHPHDMNVIAARENLEHRAAGIKDPERKANLWSLSVFIVLSVCLTLALLIGVTVFDHTHYWPLTIMAGVVVAGCIAEAVWEGLEYSSKS